MVLEDTKEKSRIYNSTKNFLFNIISQFIIIFMSFITRKIFIAYLGSTYLGLNGIFTNIISLLSLAELGIGNVLLFTLYKPIASNDEEKINQILKFFRNVYRVIMLVIFACGLVFIPLLPQVLNGVQISSDIILIYCLFLLNAVCSYIYAYRNLFIVAKQKNYIITRINLIFVIIKEIFQIIILVLTQNFIFYMLLTVLTTTLSAVYIGKIGKSFLPSMGSTQSNLTKEEKKNIFSSVKDLFIYRISNVALYGTDNLLISIILASGTIIVGIYSNYVLIIETLNKLITTSFTSIMASLGNLNAEDDHEKKYYIFKVLNFTAYFVNGFASICLLVLYQDFITLFAGSSYLLDKNVVIVIVISFYVAGCQTPIWMFRETTGLFKKTKYMAVLLVILNLVLSIIFGKIWGIFGILLATVIARILTTNWFEPFIILKKYLHKSLSLFWINYLLFLLKILLTAVFTYYICTFIAGNTIYLFAIKSIICGLVAMFILILLNVKCEEFKYISRFFLKLIIKKKEIKNV